MKYNEFLFSQLFMHYVENNETIYQHLEYDLIFKEILINYDYYKSSIYYLSFKSEYECIKDYLNNEIELITTK